jgi:hypothetical protein
MDDADAVFPQATLSSTPNGSAAEAAPSIPSIPATPAPDATVFSPMAAGMDEFGDLD